MATEAQINAVLDAAGYGTKAKIIKSIPGASKTQYYCTGGVDYRGKARWVECNTADSASTQAAAIQAGLAA